MRLLGDARRLLGGWGDDVRLGSALVPVIGVGVASKMKYYDTALKNMPALQDASPSVVKLRYRPPFPQRPQQLVRVCVTPAAAGTSPACLNLARRFWKGTKRAPTAKKRKVHSTFPTPATRTCCTAPPPLTS